ncbi:MAG: hypothetical protein KGZ79_11425 [Dethiobacter sp.]|jgi:hypothetical protein|nr:hypothetical protein [Dethiobacter sp.]
MDVTLTLSHWLYLLIVLVVIITMIKRRDVVMPSLVGIFLLGLLYAEGSAVSQIVFAIQTSFRALLTAGEDLFDIMLVIALMVAMLKAMSKLGADNLMVAPARRLLKNPHIGFFALGSVMYICALFFWPTPATALVGVMLVPVAISAGLPAMAAAMAVNIFGHGMGLSGDLIIQGAPGLSERTAGLVSGSMLTDVAILSWVAGIVAIGVAYMMMHKEISANYAKVKSGTFVAETSLMAATSETETSPHARTMAILVPVTFIAIVALMILTKYIPSMPHLRGGDATALLGGAAVLMLIINSIAADGNKALESIVEHIRYGLNYAIKIFAPVIPIAGFFFLGAGAATQILGEGAPALLFDLGRALANALPMNKFALSFGNVIIGIITGLDGSGFSGLPLTASLAAALGPIAGVRVEALAAIGQMGAVWSGGGTLAAWAFGLVATAGIAGVNPLDLARKNFIPVISGLTVAAIVAMFLM